MGIIELNAITEVVLKPLLVSSTQVDAEYVRIRIGPRPMPLYDLVLFGIRGAGCRTSFKALQHFLNGPGDILFSPGCFASRASPCDDIVIFH